MVSKSLLFSFLFIIICSFAKAQQNRLLIKHHQHETSLKVGDNVRLAYPSNLLEMKQKNAKEIIGLRGKIDSITQENIWLKPDMRSKRTIKVQIKEILSIKKISGGGQFLAFLVTYGAIGGSALAVTNSLELNPGIQAFSTVVAVFPAAIITANVLYPAKPAGYKKKDYSISVITL